jgi:hypothetical protein
VGYQTVKRSVFPDSPLVFPPSFSRTLGILIPDLFFPGFPEGVHASAICRPWEEDFRNVGLKPGELIFFDLETTGLSLGAGTAAFLAAFGRLTDEEEALPGGERSFRLRVDQYLLLDYPGEDDFLGAQLRELSPIPQAPSAYAGGGPRRNGVPVSRPPSVVTYNGKAFDAQILKNRCLTKGLIPPEYRHIDLLHPARRLWKRLLPSCSQREIETAVLGLDRGGDLPGALAPDIWFSFLKTGETGDLMRVCDHNLRDVQGLASLFALFSRIAFSPLKTLETYPYDLENLALRWRKVLKRGTGWGKEEQDLGEDLLRAAAERGGGRAGHILGLDLLNRGFCEEGRIRLREMLSRDYSDEIKAALLRTLAMDAEWRLRNRKEALAYVESALGLKEIRETMKKELFHRRERLLKYI